MAASAARRAALLDILSNFGDFAIDIDGCGEDVGDGVMAAADASIWRTLERLIVARLTLYVRRSPFPGNFDFY